MWEVRPVLDNRFEGTDPEGVVSSRYKDLGEQQAKSEYAAAVDNGWEYDADAMQQHIKELRTLYEEKSTKLIRLAGDLTDVEALGNEEVSLSYIGDINSSGTAYNRLLESSMAFLESYIETLKKVDKAYQEEDAEAKEQLRSVDI